MPRSKRKLQADALVTGSGTIYQLFPLSTLAKDWVDEYVHVEDWMRMGSSICVEHRYIADIVEGMQNDGLRVAVRQ